MVLGARPYPRSRTGAPIIWGQHGASTRKHGKIPSEMNDTARLPIRPPAGGKSHNASKTALIGRSESSVVFGDIAPARSMPSVKPFAGSNPLALDNAHVLGVVSLIFWSMTLVVSIQYVTILMRADNKGQGGSLAWSR